MRYSQWAVLSVLSSGILFANTSNANLKISNGSLTNVVSVTTFAGVAKVPAGYSIDWPIDSSAINAYGVDGSALGTWIGQPGHDYVVTCDGPGSANLVDMSPAQTYWFWYGFAFTFAAFVLSLGARWTRKTIVGGVNEFD